jgi:hypothetical protein
MSEADATKHSQGRHAKARSPVERALVYGFIVVLIVLVGVEAKGKFAHKSAVDTITARLRTVENSKTAAEITEVDIQHELGGRKPLLTEYYTKSASGIFAASKKLEVYSWFSLNPTQKRELWVHYARKGASDEQPCVVVSISTDKDEAPAQSSLSGRTPSDAPAAPTGPPRKLGPGNPGPGVPTVERHSEDNKREAATPGEEAKPGEEPAEEGKAPEENSDPKQPDEN